MVSKLISYSEVLNSKRLDGKFFLNDDAVLSRHMQDHSEKCVPLTTKTVAFNPPIFKRQFCEGTASSVHYFQSSDVNSRFDYSSVYINADSAKKARALVTENQILVTGFGSIGDIRLVNNLNCGSAYANNVCRIDVKKQEFYGYVYAFLSTKYGRAQLNRNASGTVVRFIEASGMKRILIPELGKELEESIHSRIKTVSALRADANLLLFQADELFHEANGLSYSEELLGVSENRVGIGSSIKLSEDLIITLKARNHSRRVNEIIKIWDVKPGVKFEDYLQEPFKIGGASTVKRINDKNFVGADMISQGDLHRMNPVKFRKVKIEKLSEKDISNEKMVLFPSVGNGSSENEIFVRPVLSYQLFDNKLLSGDIGKLRCNSKEDAAYLYAALNSRAGFRIMRAKIYGTQLRRPNWSLLKNINIPIASEIVKELVAKNVLMAFEKFSEARTEENKVISLIEQEIDSWQK